MFHYWQLWAQCSVIVTPFCSMCTLMLCIHIFESSLNLCLLWTYLILIYILLSFPLLANNSMSPIYAKSLISMSPILYMHVEKYDSFLANYSLLYITINYMSWHVSYCSIVLVCLVPFAKIPIIAVLFKLHYRSLT